MNLQVAVTFERSENAGAGAGDTFQIASVIDTDTGTNLTRGLDLERHFSDRAELEDYLREKVVDVTDFELAREH